MHSSSIHFIIFSFERLEQSISRGQALVKRSFEFSQLCQEASETCLSLSLSLAPAGYFLHVPTFSLFFFLSSSLLLLRAYFLVFFFFSFLFIILPFFLSFLFFSPSLIRRGIQRSQSRSRSVAGVSRTLLFSIFSRPIVWNRTCM